MFLDRFFAYVFSVLGSAVIILWIRAWIAFGWPGDVAQIFLICAMPFVAAAAFWQSWGCWQDFKEEKCRLGE